MVFFLTSIIRSDLKLIRFLWILKALTDPYLFNNFQIIPSRRNECLSFHLPYHFQAPSTCRRCISCSSYPFRSDQQKKKEVVFNSLTLKWMNDEQETIFLMGWFGELILPCSIRKQTKTFSSLFSLRLSLARLFDYAMPTKKNLRHSRIFTCNFHFLNKMVL